MARSKEFDQLVVLDKAMQTFWEKGYEKTSMQDLVDRMEIHRRSIYDTFGDKHALFLMALDRYDLKLEKEIHSRVKQDMPIQEKLRQLFSIVLSEDEVTPKGCLIVNTAAELSLLDEEVSMKIQSLFSKSETYLYQLLALAQEKGEIHEEDSLADLASYLHNAWVGLRLQAKTTNDIKKLHAIIETTLTVLN